MTSIIVVTEGKSDIMILKGVLPPEIVSDVRFISGEGKYGARSMASTILTVRREAVALVVDADTEDELTIREMRRSLEELLDYSGAATRFKVFLAVPELEILLVQDKQAIERVAGHPITDAEWVTAQHRPQIFLDSLNRNRELIISQILADTSAKELDKIRRHELIKELTDFLAEALVPGSVADSVT